MIKKIKASLSEKIIFIFVLLLGLFFLSSFFFLKDKCLFVKDYDPLKITFDNPKPFVTLKLSEKGNLPRTKPPEGARLRIVSESNVSLDKVRKAVDIAKYRYNPYFMLMTGGSSPGINPSRASKRKP